MKAKPKQFVPLSSGGGFIVQAMDADRAELTDDDDAVYEALEAIDDSKWKVVIRRDPW